jgi:gluconolactonase
MRSSLQAAARLIGLLVCMRLSVAGAQPAQVDSAAQPFRIERLDPSLDELIAPDAQARTIAAGFGFSDGPVWIKGRGGAEGYLLAVSIIDNVIYKVTAAGRVSVFLDHAGYSGSDVAEVGKLALIGRAHVILIGPNCTGVDRQGRVIWCAGQDLALMRLEQDGTRTVLAAGFAGRHFNGPNDVAIARDGAIYFTDSDVGLRGGIHSPRVQMPDSVWRWQDGEVALAVSREQLGAEPNGIALSPDDRYLYLSAGTGSADPRLMRCPVRADGSIAACEVFAHGRGIGDGMKADRLGNLYSTDGPLPLVRITSPAGRPLGLLHLPVPSEEEPRKTVCASALAFGGDDGRTLYVTACEYLYAIALKSPGILEGPD